MEQDIPSCGVDRPSHAIYLFSGFLVYLAAKMAEGISPSLVPFIAIIVGIPLGLFLPPLVQVGVDRAVDLIFRRRRSAT